MEDRLANISLSQSSVAEQVLISVGFELHAALVRAVRLDEVELIMDLIGEYSTMCSFYGEKTNRIPESLGVDLNEAALYKRQMLLQNKLSDSSYEKFSYQFANNLRQVASELEIKP